MMLITSFDRSPTRDSRDRNTGFPGGWRAGAAPFPPRGARCAAGFTLFEVAISLVILAFGVISIMTLFPAGLKAQQLSRFQVLAAAKALEMIEQFNTTHFDNPMIDTEGTELWNIASSYRSQTWDIEARLSSHRYGIMPLPLELAQRLDSDGDEIASILAEGGYIYYSQPQASTNMHEISMEPAPPNEAQRLIIGIKGYAQQNSLPIFGLKNWPYFANFPSPPVHFNHISDSWLPPPTGSGPDYFPHYNWPVGFNRSDSVCATWETARVPGLTTPIPGTDPDMQKVFDWPEGSVHYGYFPYACGRQWDVVGTPPTRLGTATDGRDGEYPSRAGVIRYVQAALWYCAQKSQVAGSGITPAFWNTIPSGEVPVFIPGVADEKKWMQVQAMRFLSHAATCLTSWYPLTGATGDNLTTGVPIQGVTLDGKPTGPLGAGGEPELRITNDLIRYYHERCVKLAMAYAASFPYDWAVPRPVERTIMVDHPLLQYDMFSPYLTGTLNGATGVTAEQWRPLAPRPIRNIGLSAIYPINTSSGRHRLEGTQVAGTASHLFGDPNHYSLTLPFDASERCRELIFWTVDWQSYEDCETLPSAPLDASRYPLAGPLMTGAGTGVASVPRNFDERMEQQQFLSEHLFCFRNPEKNMLWLSNYASLQPTGTEIPDSEQMRQKHERDQGPWLAHRQIFNGLWGADRNYNFRIDRGRLPKSVRLRAVQVVRFNFYDPRLVCLLR